MLKRVLPSALAVTFLTMTAWATFSPPPSVPIDRLIRNTEAFIKVPPFESGPPQVQTSGDLTALWREAAIAEYRKAYELAIDKDQAVPYLPLAGLAELVSYEAGVRYVAMIASRGVKVEERPFLAIVQTELIRLESKPRGAITPIIFSIDRSAPLDELLGNRTVEFDLDGTARPQRYSWVLPDTGILVWDPEHKGQITSGRQLFGSVTFNMLWSDGYRALDVLDDNRNGMVDGDELPGLAVWFDRKGDGMSDPGEVEPVENIAIQAISTWATHHVGDSLANYQGLQLTDEETLPTYDWTTRNLVGIDD